jgi:LysM repeat protein
MAGFQHFFETKEGVVRNKRTQTTNTMKKFAITIGFIGASTIALSSEAKISRSEYVDKWSSIAVQQMMQHNIPASITLAQGILESGSGNSELAVKGNNHFGIKCHGWEGKKMYIDDDKKNECFRVYKSAKQSFEDHSAFLMKYDRYKFLFTYDVTNYKAWAKGLKKAGYATNPKYPERLITIIEELGLHDYDRLSTPDVHVEPTIVAESSTKSSIMSNTHNVYVHENKVKYVIAREGDTFYKISREFGVSLRQLSRYNDFSTKKDVLETGDIIYLQPKRRSSLFTKKETVLQKDMTVLELSQETAVNPKSIKRLNDFADDNDLVSEGVKVTLR